MDSAVARIVWSSWHVLKKPVVGVWAAFPCAAVVSSVTMSVCAIPEILHVIQTSTYQLWRITSCVGSFLRAAAWICVHIWHTLSRFGGAISFETYFCHGRGNTGFTPHTCGGKNPKHVLKSDSLYKCDVHALFFSSWTFSFGSHRRPICLFIFEVADTDIEFRRAHLLTPSCCGVKGIKSVSNEPALSPILYSRSQMEK